MSRAELREMVYKLKCAWGIGLRKIEVKSDNLDIVELVNTEEAEHFSNSTILYVQTTDNSL